MTEDAVKLSKQEAIKRESHYLKGKIAEDLADKENIAITEESYELLKFHGTYEGYDRDTATARKKQGLDKHYEFMLRLKMPGGRLTAAQYLALDTLSDIHANGTLRITTRETFQFHCVLKGNLGPFITEINKILLSTIAGCGDVVRNIMTCPAPIKDKIHARLEQDCYELAKYMAPKTNSYYELWLDGEKLPNYPFNPDPAPAGGPAEPLYGETYMPRKFKIGIAQPEDNCIDVMTHDLALLALFDGQELKGYNVALGGGLGMTHNTPKTYPRLATPLVFAKPDELIDISDAVVRLQRDYGDRGDRKHARLKYVIDEKGLAWTRGTLEFYFGKPMPDPIAMPKFAIENHMGWHEQGDGKWFLGVPISSGRIIDREEEQIRTGLREVIKEYGMKLVLTADQNIILCDIETVEKAAIAQKLRKYGIKLVEDITLVYKDFLACVALPTCGKALAEAERVKLPMVDNIEQVLRRHDLIDEKIAIRIAGCPNGCSRPYVGDIGIVGRMPDHYALFIGGDFEGTRLNEKIFDKVHLDNVHVVLEPMFALYREGKQDGEGFGDFCTRVGVSKVKQAAVDALGATIKLS